MIRRIYSDLPKFKNVDFRQGLNILLAEKSPGASDRHTRNRAGKSSLLDVIHFLLGASCDKDSIFRSETLQSSTFGMELDLAGSFSRVERSGSHRSQVRVAGDSTRWPVPPSPKGDEAFLSNENWKTVLGKMMFGLDEFDGAWAPSFRSLISYFVRRERAGGMIEPMMSSRKQRTVDQQVNVSFLLGLDWSVPRRWQEIRDRERALEQLRKGMSEGALGSVIGKAASLKSELIVAEDRVKRLKGAVSSFKVVDEYHDLEREASRITSRLADLADENLLDERYISEIETTTIEEVPPPAEDLEVLYKEAGIVLPGLVKKRFDEVSLFHDSVVRNRRAYLRSEVEAARRRIAERSQEMQRLDSRRSEVMTVLKTTGALEHFSALQGELSKIQATAEALRQKHATAEALETGDLKLRVERAGLLEQLHRSYAEEGSVIEEAVLAFREISSQLYEDDKSGNLTISPTENGPVFEPHIPGDKSKGVNNMRIFCFDLTLMLLSLKRGRSPSFLVHDSHFFDGVDERQVGRALAVAADLAEKHGFQYIVTMNTDDLPAESPRGFSPDEFVLPVRLTDASEDGGLFGFRFA